LAFSSYFTPVFVAYLVLFLLTAVWGLTFPLVQGALAYASPLVFLALRFAIAAAVFPLVVWPRAFRLNKRAVLEGGAIGLFLWGGYALQTFGLAHTTAARSGFLTGTLVPMTPLFSWLIFRHRIGPRAWIAVLLAFAGTAVMSQPTAGGFNLGDGLTLLCAVFFAFQIIFINRWARRDNEIQLTWTQILATGILCVIAMPVQPQHLQWSPYLIAALLITALFATTIGIWAQLRFQPRISATAAAIIYACEPIFAGLAAWLIQGNAPNFATLIGASLIFSGMILSAIGPTDLKPEIP
jgi:drug/metabolite transporter (DMT)-like permease